MWNLGELTYFACEIESVSVVTSNLCAGSSGRFVSGSIGLLTLLYSASWTAVSRSKCCFRYLFSLLHRHNKLHVSNTEYLYRKSDRTTYSLVLGHSLAALRIYSGPRTNLFQRLIAFLWSFRGLNSEASSLEDGS